MPDLLTLKAPGITLAEQRQTHLVMVRLRNPSSAVIAAVGAAIGVALPTEPNTAAGSSPRAIWMGPGEWLVIGPGADIAAIEAAAAGCAAVLAVPVGDGRFAIDLEGKGARDLLAKAVSVDLHPRAFPAGRTAITLFAQIPVVIDHMAEDHYRLWFDVSLRRYVHDWCRDALVEFA